MAKSKKTLRINTQNSKEKNGKLLTLVELQEIITGKSPRLLAYKRAGKYLKDNDPVKDAMDKVEVLAMQNQSKLIQQLKETIKL